MLGDEAVRRLLERTAGTSVSGGFARACRSASGGNPFLLCELARTLHAAEVPFNDAGSARVVEMSPPRVTAAVGATLRRLGSAAALLARAAALLGDGCALDLAAELAGVEMADAWSASVDHESSDNTPRPTFRAKRVRGRRRRDAHATRRAGPRQPGSWDPRLTAPGLERPRVGAADSAGNALDTARSIVVEYCVGGRLGCGGGDRGASDLGTAVRIECSSGRGA
jgi:hypothetical protein